MDNNHVRTCPILLCYLTSQNRCVKLLLLQYYKYAKRKCKMNFIGFKLSEKPKQENVVLPSYVMYSKHIPDIVTQSDDDVTSGDADDRNENI